MQETVLFVNTVKKGIDILSRFEARDIIINKNSNSIAKILESNNIRSKISKCLQYALHIFD